MQNDRYTHGTTRHKPGCLKYILLVLVVFFLFFTPVRINVLVIGIDRVPAGTALGRTDTMILTSLPPMLPRMTLFSIPRDLWVTLPGGGENRINTAHYFAELYQPGTGMTASQQVVAQNFSVPVNYSVRINFDGFEEIVKAMGGVTVVLPEPMSGLSAGRHELNSKEALAFVRDRSGSDDFWRQKRGQIFIKAAVLEMLNPLKWLRIPAVVVTLFDSVESNVPFWLWPRLVYGAMFSAVTSFEAHTLDMNMVNPWVTADGASVLLPNWELINPLVSEIFK